MAVRGANERSFAGEAVAVERDALPAVRRALGWSGAFAVALLLMLAWGATTRPQNDFAQNVWLPARLLLDGASPYFPDRSQVDAALGQHSGGFPIFNSGAEFHFIYPAWVAAALSPFALLPLELATALWRALTLVLAAWACGAILRSTNIDFRKASPAVWAAIGTTALACLIFRPSIVNLALGQFAAIELALLAGIWGWLATSRDMPAERRFWGDALTGLGLAVLATKPQSVGLAVLLVGLWAISRRRFAIPVSAVLSLAVLLLAPLVFYPDSLGDFSRVVLGSQASSQAPVSASVWGLSHAVLGEGSAWVAVSIALSLAGLVLLLPAWWRDLRTSDAPVPLSLPLTLCVNSIISPYLLGYEQVVLLVPALVLLAYLGMPGTGPNGEPERQDRRLLRVGLYAWLLVLPLLLAIPQQMARSEYPLVIQAVLLLVACRVVRPALRPRTVALSN